MVYFDNYGYVNNFDIVEIQTIPEGIVRHKYNYNSTDGFYLNPSYIEPISREELDNVKQQLALTQQALDDLILGGA